ncbi:type I polyketide synthase [Pelomyxa schiedti]|nr:type I polyketide synthase [Pelomyxa schiedti]
MSGGDDAGNDRFLVAVIGTSCKFPTARNLDEYYQLLHECADAVRQIPAYKLDTGVHCGPGKIKTPYAGTLEEPVTSADPSFFGLSGKEASFLGPVQHQLLQLSCEALADAGEPFPVASSSSCTRKVLPGGNSTGVFVASFGVDWPVILMQSEPDISPYTANGAALAMLSNRLSWFFDFRGPSLTVDTACSGSLVALHLAYSSMRAGECSSALVAASNQLLLPQFSLAVSRAGMTTSSGRCNTFGSNADGYVRAEGGSAFLLKPLSDAVANGDHIYCVIAGTANNHDGSKQFINRPSSTGQITVLQQALKVAHVDPRDVTYIEAHGTGTPVGDPIEVDTLRSVFSEDAVGTRGPCFIGSVKSNIGHTEAAAGLASLTKVLLMIQHNEIFPQRLVPLDPHFNLGSLAIPWKGEQWSKVTKRKIAVVNSFGFGGSNATAVIEEYIPPLQTPPSPTFSEESIPGEKPIYCLPISAHTSTALSGCAKKWHSFLSTSKASLSDIIYSAGKRSNHYSQRLVVLGRNPSEMCQSLESFIQNPKAQEDGWKSGTAQFLKRNNKVLFVFSGQGPQWYAMGRQLYAEDAIFHDALSKVDVIGKRVMGWSVVEELHKTEAESRVNQTQFAQVLIFAVQIGLNSLWRHWGIVPDAVVGHSVGEVAAAVACGYLTLEEGVLVISVRSRLQQALSGKGRMLAINMSAAKAAELITGVSNVDIASVNSADSVVLAGDPAALASVEKTLKAKDQFAKFLHVQNAFHSYQTEPIKEQLIQELQTLAPAPHPKIPMYSTVLGKVLHDPPGPDYWWKNVRCSVLFYPAILSALEEKFNVFVELANHPVLSLYLEATAASTPKTPTFIVHSIERNKPERHVILSALSTLYVNGIGNLNWDNISKHPLLGIEPEDKMRWIKVPNSPVWQNTVQIFEPKHFTTYRRGLSATHSLLGLRDDSPIPSWSNVVALNLYPWISDHKVSAGEDIVVPGAFYAELATLAAREVFRTSQVRVANLVFHSPVILSPDSYVEFKCIVTNYHPTGKRMGFEVHTKAESEKSLSKRASCNIEVSSPSEESTDELSALKTACKLQKGHSTVYKAFSEMGLNYGPLFSPISKIFINNTNFNEALGQLTFRHSVLESVTENFALHPTVLDGCFQCIIGGLLSVPDLRGSNILLPASVGELEILSQPSPIQSKDFDFQVELKGDFAPQYDKVEEDRLVMALQENPHLILLCKYYSALFCKAVEGTTNWTPSKQKYINWHRSISTDFVPNPDIPLFPFKVMTIESEIIHSVGKNVVHVLNNSGSLFEDDKLSKFYSESVTCNINTTSFPVLRKLLQCGKRIRILEIGGGTGGATKQFLPLCQEAYTNGCDVEYIFTDVSPFFVSSAKEMFGHIPFVQCSTLDIAKPFPDELREVNVIIAFAVVHVASEVGPVLSRIFDALSPGGVLLLTEPTRKDSVFFNFLFGLFDQWWANDPKDRDHVCLSREEWTQRLYKTGFSAVVSDNGGSKGIELAFASFLAQKPLSSARNFSSFWCHTKIRDFVPQKSLVGDAILMDITGKPLVSVKNLCLSSVTNKATNISLGTEKWIPKPLEIPLDTATTVHNGTLLVLSCENCRALSHSLVSSFRPQYREVIVIVPGPTYEETGSVLSLDPLNKEHWLQLFKSVGKSTEHIIDLWPASYYSTQEPLEEDLKRASLDGALHLAYMCTALGQANIICGVVVITQGVQDPQQTRSHFPGMSLFSVWGVARVICAETSLCVKVIDLDPSANIQESTAHISSEILFGWNAPVETEICIHKNQRFCERVNFYDLKDEAQHLELPPVPTVTEEGWELQLDEGTKHIRFVKFDAGRALAPTEVCTEMKYTGLNFKDFLLSQGLLDVGRATDHWHKYGKLGLEGSGVVKRVGSAVTHVKPGDEVIVMTRLGTLCSHLISTFYSVFPKPPTLSAEEAAVVMIPSWTAVYSLLHCTKVRKGELILVHSAAGGVGLAFVHLARSLGLQVIATASTEAKMNHLKQVVGLENVFMIKDPSLTQKVMDLTFGRGVDIVVNPYTGALAEQSVQMLASNGRFIQLIPGQQLPVNTLSDNQSVHIVELSRIPDKEVFYELGPEILKLASQLSGVLPVKMYDTSHIQDALQQFSNPDHIGKIAVTLNTPSKEDLHPLHSGHSWLCNVNASYLISGGLSGFGFATAKWLYDHGAKNIVLASREGKPKTISDAQEVEWLKRHGCKVLCLSLDVCNYESAVAAIKVVESEMPRIEGVYHCATTHGDCSLYNLTSEKFSRVCLPKLLGAWNLHKVTLSHPVKQFVMFSSISSLFGRGGQTPYVAGNYFMDKFVQYRHYLGLPALSIQWGAIGETGVLTTSPWMAMTLAADGVNQVPAKQSLACLYTLLSRKESDSAVSVFSIDMNAFYPSNKGTLNLARFSENTFVDETTQKPVSGDSSVFSLLKARLAKTLGIDEQTIGEDMVLASQGIDSLVATSLRTWIMSELGVSISPLKLLSGITIAELAAEISTLRGEVPSVDSPPQSTVTAKAAAPDTVAKAASTEVPKIAETSSENPKKPSSTAIVTPTSSISTATLTSTPAPATSSASVSTAPMGALSAPGAIRRRVLSEWPAPQKRRISTFITELNKMRSAGIVMHHLDIDHYGKNNKVTFRNAPGTKGELKTALLLQSNNYHGLFNDPRMIKASQDKPLISSLGSALQAGILPEQAELQREIAEFCHCEAALITPSGFTANLTLLSAVAQSGDYIFSDALNHASINDGCRLSGASIVPFKHMDYVHLESLLQDTPQNAGKVIVTDAVFSMEGHIANLPVLDNLARKYDCVLVLDEAHSMGVLGATGRGIEEHFNMFGAAHWKSGTLSKAICSLGGYVCGPKDGIDWLVYNSRPYVFSTGISDMQCHIARTGLRIIREEPWRVKMIQDKAAAWKKALEDAGFVTFGTSTPIVPILIGNDETCVAFSRRMLDNGLFATPIVSRGGSVPPGSARVRTNVNSHHSMAELLRAAQILRSIKAEFKDFPGAPSPPGVPPATHITFDNPDEPSTALADDDDDTEASFASVEQQQHSGLRHRTATAETTGISTAERNSLRVNSCYASDTNTQCCTPETKSPQTQQFRQSHLPCWCSIL